MQMVDGIASALLDLLELQLVAHTNTGDQVIQAAVHSNKYLVIIIFYHIDLCY